MKKILISTGGSGGHVIPATTLYDHLKTKFEVKLVLDNRGKDYIDKKIYNFDVIDVPKFKKNIFFFPKFLILFFISIFKSLTFLKRNNINYLISTGGYMSIPFCIAAKIINLNIFLFEPNIVLGRSNKLMLIFAKKIFCYYKNIINFPKKFEKKIVLIDRLLRKNSYNINKNRSKEMPSNFKILVVGGSQGSSFFDENIKEVVKKLSKKKKFFLLQQISNSIKREQIAEIYEKLEIDYKLFSYDEDLHNKIKDYDIAITRCGASALSDLLFFNIPFLAIPFPYAKDNHQYHNAKYFSDLNCCWLLDQNNLNSEKILDILLRVINDKNDYLTKKKNIEKISSLNNWEKINQKLIYILNENQTS